MGLMDDIDFVAVFNKLPAEHRNRWMALSDEQKEKRVAEALTNYMKSGDGILRRIIKPVKVG